MDRAFRAAYRAGVAPHFWGLTPHELTLCCEEFNEQQKDVFRLALITAWHSAAWMRAKRMPDLKSVLRRVDNQAPPQQTPEQMLALVESINAALGGRDLRSAKRLPDGAKKAVAKSPQRTDNKNPD